ncbi:hypothetical protein KQ878_00830 [Mycoplasma zalophidermidis]|uniref:Uncharacterized protein n=1 Tax=Mycoplasma zalophidermidis TaxID=398174 RepID=A0ABS6DR14_9MOLU|nr:hypothetical protein [Mycoplasma zalophidermidis]MBU4693430.1 hypothetical protein [Mycoplasma zalophidermidis]
MWQNLLDGVYYGVFIAFWYLLVVLPLILLKAVLACYDLIAIALPQYILFGISLTDSFEVARFPNMFLRLLIISVFMYVMLLISSLIRLHFWKGENEPNPVSVALKYSFLATLWLIGIPIVLYIFNMLVGLMIKLTLSGNEISLDRQLFNNLFAEGHLKGFTRAKWDSVYDNAFLIKDSDYKELAWGQGIQIIFLGCLISCSTLIPLVLGLLTVVQKIFQQFFLFIISPFVASSAIADDGKRLKLWGQMYFGKGFAIISLAVGVQILSAFLNQSFNWVSSLNINFFIRILLILGVSVGGAVASMGISSEVAAFVGESASIRETLSETKGLMAAGMALAGGAGLALKGTGKMLKAGGKAAKTGAVALTKGRRGLEALNAKRELRAQLSKGKIDKSEYQMRAMGLNQKIHDRNESVKLARRDTKLENQVLRGQIDAGESNLKKSDLRASNAKLTKLEAKNNKKLAKLGGKTLSEKGSAKYNQVLGRQRELRELIDKRIERNSGDSLTVSKTDKMNFENAKRAKFSASTIAKKENIIQRFEKKYEGKEMPKNMKNKIEQMKSSLTTDKAHNNKISTGLNAMKDKYSQTKRGKN